MEIGDLHRAGEFVGDCPDHELIVSFTMAVGEGVYCINDIVAESQLSEPIEMPAIAFFDNVMEKGNRLFLRPLDAIGHSLTMAHVRLTCFVRLAVMRFRRDLSGHVDVRRAS